MLSKTIGVASVFQHSLRQNKESFRCFGLLKVGTPLPWEDTTEHCKYIREHGLRQFLEIHERVKSFANDRLLYGDETEHAILKFNAKDRTVKLSLRSVPILDELRKREGQIPASGVSDSCTWHQEYGKWMVEGTPALPYGGYTTSLLQMEHNMRLRRARMLAVLEEDEMAPTVVAFPLMGVGEFTDPPAPPGGPASMSESVPDTVINPHPRFGTLTANIRSRRGSKVDIRVPLFIDKATFVPVGEAPEIKMDCMAYGMGCCCLQVTFQASDIVESRYLYDQLAPLTPIMMALTAATPIFQGRLANIDVRWSTISASVDCRTPAERGNAANAVPDPQLAGEGVRQLAKSRYDSISHYLYMDSPIFNDVPCEIDQDFKKMLLKKGIDNLMAQHLAHLFVRDPLVAFEGSITEVDDKTSTEHFDSINSTNWQSVRWKPPPAPEEAKPHIGWRTEFRTMELQLTDFENAAFSAFIVLLTRVILVFDLDILIPLSKVDENMRRGHSVDAVNTEKFWFETNVLPSRIPRDNSAEMTMSEIISGKNGGFPGLVPLCYAYLEHIQCDAKSFERIDQYLTFITKRAAGELITPATWMRRFVLNHPEYKQDSVISEGIAYDLMFACDEIGRGVRKCPELLGDVDIVPVTKDDAYMIELKNVVSHEARAALLEKLTQRAAADDGPGSLPRAPLRNRRSAK